MDHECRLTEREAINKASELIPGGSQAVSRFNREERDKAIVLLNSNGLTSARICRVAGIGKTVVYKVLKR